MTKSEPEQTRKFYWLQIGVAITAIFIAVIWTSYGLEDLMDVRFYDESYYLCQGLFQPIGSWLADYSPLYSLYYKALSAFQPDAISIYFLNYRVWAIFLATTILIVLIRFGVNTWFAAIWAIASFSSQFNYPLWPKAGHLAMVGIAVGLMGLYSLRKKRTQAFVWISGLCFMLSWCRPEFVLGGFLAIGFFIFEIIRNPKSFSFTKVWIVFPWIFAIGFAIFWGLPFGHSGRGIVAFGQHFIHNRHVMMGLPEKDLVWDWVNWREQFELVFGKTNSIFEAIIANPAAILRHLWYNFRYLIYNSITCFFETLFPVRWLGLSVLMCVGVFWIGAEWIGNFNGMSLFLSRLKLWIQKYGAFGLCFSISSLAAGLLFQPRTHYILPLFPVFLVVMAILISGYDFSRFTWFQKQISGVFVLVLALIFLPKANAFFELKDVGSQPKNLPESKNHFSKITSDGLKNRKLILELQNLNFPQNTRIFDGSTGATEFLGTKVIQTGKTGFEMNYPELKDFKMFLEREKVTAIYLAETMKYDHFFAESIYFQEIKARPELFGWKKKAIPMSGDSLLAR